MNNELKYAVNGALLMILFFISLKFMFFILSLDEPSQKSPMSQIDPAVIESLEKKDSIFDKGKQLFAFNCSPCHAINKTDAMMLAGIDTRVPDKQLLYAWIRNSQEVIKSGNKYFTDLSNQYNNVAMSSFPNLTNEEIDAILLYIKIQSNSGY